MQRLFGLLMVLVILSACGSTAPGAVNPAPEAGQPATSAQVRATNTPVVPASADPAAKPTPDPAAPVFENELMKKLGVTGEQYATMGDPNAPITMIEFSDYGCPFCNRYVTTTFPEIKKLYIDTGKVFYIYKDFPVLSLHPQAQFASEVAECSGEQGYFWEMHEQLFEYQGFWDGDEMAARKTFQNFAGKLGLDPEQFMNCLESDKHLAEIQKDMAEGQRLGTNGTPTFVINGKQLVGSQPLTAFVNAIDFELRNIK